MKKCRVILLMLVTLSLLLMVMFSACSAEDPSATTAKSNLDVTVTTKNQTVITTTLRNPATTVTVTEVAVTTATVTSGTTERLPSEWVSAVFGGGPFVTGGTPVANIMKASGFNTMIIWSVHVLPDGTLKLNDIEVCKDGKYIGSGRYKTAWQSLKEGKTSIERVEISVGAWECQDFDNIKALIERDGTGKDTVLYKNFAALIEATGADAVNYDDETCYDLASAVKFTEMCADMGVKVTLCPYNNMNFWVSLNNSVGEYIDRIYLQCYAGGAGNDPEQWSLAFGEKVIPGYWCLHNNGEGTSVPMLKRTLRLSGDEITGAFIWFYDDLQKLSSPNSAKDYAAAINEAKK